MLYRSLLRSGSGVRSAPSYIGWIFFGRGGHCFGKGGEREIERERERVIERLGGLSLPVGMPQYYVYKYGIYMA